MLLRPFAAITTFVLIGGAASHAGQQQSTSQSDPKLPKTFRLPRAVRPSESLEVVRSTTKEYSDRAKGIALVKCTGRRVDYGPGGNIFTFYTFETEETVKGKETRTIRVRLFGGTIGDTSVSLAIDPELSVDSEYILMFGPDNAEGFATLNPAAIFTVKTEPQSGKKVVVPGANGLVLYQKSTSRKTVSSPDWAFLDDFVYSLKKALN